MSMSQLLEKALEINSDPLVNELLLAPKTRIPFEVKEAIEKDKHDHAIVISGLQEAPESTPASERQDDLQKKALLI
ncbi:unnamed protein product [Nippostrongylus brasiliensis]|uniref:Reverse transcriptase domain-containing protein n=1 Tax=Nippostrongylus brasiliensis TaxID=27835 RepID=A0A0N4YD95_NIPBR|nr:unnamed protein product [Nippostrongylus brasiliensis]